MNDPYDVTRELAVKRPATVTRIQPRGRAEIMSAPYIRKAALVEEVRRQEARGLVVVLDEHPTYRKAGDQWEVRVRRLEEVAARPRWVKPVLWVGGVLLTLALLALAGLWVWHTLAAIPGVVLLAVILLVFLAWVGMGHGGGSRRATQVDVDVRVRVW